MKLTLLVLFLASTMAYADQASNSFGTGFADALRNAIQQQEQAKREANAQPQGVGYPNAGHFDVMDNYGNLGGFEFYSMDQCQRYLNNTQIYRDCIWVIR